MTITTRLAKLEKVFNTGNVLVVLVKPGEHVLRAIAAAKIAAGKEHTDPKIVIVHCSSPRGDEIFDLTKYPVFNCEPRPYDEEKPT